MPRLSRRLLPGYPVHVLQRGHNRARCFESDSDQILYLGLLQEFSRRHACGVHAYVLMTNHIHLLVSPPPDTTRLSSMMRDINQIYVQHMNRHHGRCGSVWQGRFKTCLVDSKSYFLNCQRYIELNPIRANMVELPWQYPWSSFSINARGLPSELVTPHPVYLGLGHSWESRQAAYRQSFERQLTSEQLARIRTSVNGGWPLGDQAFLREMESLGIGTTPGKGGRPRKQKPGTDPGRTPVFSSRRQP